MSELMMIPEDVEQFKQWMLSMRHTQSMRLIGGEKAHFSGCHNAADRRVVLLHLWDEAAVDLPYEGMQAESVKRAVDAQRVHNRLLKVERSVGVSRSLFGDVVGFLSHGSKNKPYKCPYRRK